MGYSTYLRRGIALFFEYDTPKIVHIRSKKVGIINRFLQLCIIGYIIGWVFLYKKGYQETDEVKSSATTKVKGVLFTNLTKTHNLTTNIYDRIWDVSDYVEPPQESNAFFVMTNMIITPGQKLTTCDEDPGMFNVTCTANNQCVKGLPVVNGNGVKTGKCINSTQKPGTKTCAIHAWCPVEVDQLPVKGVGVLKDSKRFTVLIKNQIEFAKFNFKSRNILSNMTESYLKSCQYDPITDPFCPIFVLEKIVSLCGENYEEMAVKGGVIGIDIQWDCNLDLSWSLCLPQYSFSRLDNKSATLAPGWNFRYSKYYYLPGDSVGSPAVLHRDLYKAYGIRFVIFVRGTAGKFNVVPMILNIGAGLALLSIATIMCDIVVLYVLKKRSYYQEKKYQTVTGDDAFDVMENTDGARSRNNAAVSTAAEPYGSRAPSRSSSVHSIQSDSRHRNLESPSANNKLTSSANERTRLIRTDED